MRAGAKIVVKGVVQGVGFRPFIHRLAVAHNLAGWVLNSSGGVIIEVEGDRKVIKHFYSQIPRLAPPLTVIETVRLDFHPPGQLNGFQVQRSLSKNGEFVLAPPDISTCEECLRELFAPGDRRYKYPFINCTNCGPRFSLIKDLPYDRARTTMEEFRMCPLCQREYEDISHRRYHAEPNACPDCGPEVELIKNEKLEMNKLASPPPLPSPPCLRATHRQAVCVRRTGRRQGGGIRREGQRSH